MWITDAHRDDRKRFVVRADEKLTALLERLQESALLAQFSDATKREGKEYTKDT